MNAKSQAASDPASSALSSHQLDCFDRWNVKREDPFQSAFHEGPFFSFSYGVSVLHLPYRRQLAEAERLTR